MRASFLLMLYLEKTDRLIQGKTNRLAASFMGVAVTRVVHWNPAHIPKTNALSDLQQLVPLLKDLPGDEHLFLITQGLLNLNGISRTIRWRLDTRGTDQNSTPVALVP